MTVIEQDGEKYIKVLAYGYDTFYNASYDTYGTTYEAVAKKVQEDYDAFNAKVKSVVEEIRQKAFKQTPYYLASEINTWLCEHNVYSNDTALGTLDNRRSAFSALMSENDAASGPVCVGYGYGFKVLADELGLTSITVPGRTVVNGKNVEHFWNRILMPDGNWYDIDSTWNDSASNKVSQRKDFFLVGSETITQPNNPNISSVYKENHPVVHENAGTLPALAVNRYEKVDPIAMINDRMYTSLQDAIDNVQENEVITLFDDVDLTEPLKVTGNKTFVFDFNGHEIRSSNTLIQIEKGSKVTLRDRTLSSDSKSAQLIGLSYQGNMYSYIIENEGVLVLESVRMYSKYAAFVSGNAFEISDNSQRDTSTSIYTLFVKPKETTILPTDISMDQSELSLKAGDSIQLTAIITPDNATYKNITWTSSNDKVASVNENGVVLAVGEGNAVITAESFTGQRVFCNVNVQEGQMLNRWEEELIISDWAYGETESNPSAKPLYGEVRFEYSSQENGTYTNIKPSTAGTWYVKAIVDATSSYTGLESKPVKFTIAKKSVSNEDIVLPSDLSGTVGTKLSQIQLPEGWSWVNQEETLTSSKKQYSAILTLDDTLNFDYTNVDGYQNNGTILRDLTVQVAKHENSFKDQLTISDWIFNDEPNKPTITASYGNDKVYFLYSEKPDGTYSATVPSTAGTWYVKAVVDATDEYTGLESEPVSFKINRKVMTDADISVPSALSGTSGDTLSEIQLPTGWSWKDDTIILSTKKDQYPAVLTLTKEDVKNYDYSNVSGYEIDKDTGTERIVCDISVKVDKKVINDISIPDNLSGTVKNKLSSISLPAGWAWEQPEEIISIGEHTYTAIFTALDEEECDYSNIPGYEAGKIKKELKVTGKKIVVNEITVPEQLSGTAGNTVSSIDLPEGWSWQNPNEILKTTTKAYTAVYTPTDADIVDYSNVEGYQNGKIIRNLEVTVSTHKNSWIEEVTISDWTYGEDANLPSAKAEFGNENMYFLYSDQPNGTYTATVPSTAGTWYVKAVVDGTSEYESLESTPKSFRIHKMIVDEIELPSNLAGTAGSMLSSIQLPEGWSWENPDEILSTSKQTARAVLTLYNEENIDFSKVEGYQSNGTIVRDVLIIISQNDNQWIDIPAISDWVYGERGTPTGSAAYGDVVFTYASTINGPFTEEQPTNAGTWFMKASVKGNEDYASLEMIIPFTIHKAMPSYTLPDDLFAIAGSRLSDVKLPKGFVWENPSLVLKKGMETSFYATFTPEDPVNYESVRVQIPVDIRLQKNEWTILPAINNMKFGEPISFTGYSRSGAPYFLYSSSIDGVYTKDVPTTAGTWYAIAKVDGDSIYDTLESDPITFVIGPKTLQDISFDEDLNVFDGNTLLQKDVDYTYTMVDMGDVYRYTITLKGNYQGVVVKDIKKNEVTDKENKPIQVTEEHSKVQDKENKKTENKKQNVQTGYKQAMQLYGLLAVSSLLVAGLSYRLRKRKVK